MLTSCYIKNSFTLQSCGSYIISNPSSPCISPYFAPEGCRRLILGSHSSLLWVRMCTYVNSAYYYPLQSLSFIRILFSNWNKLFALTFTSNFLITETTKTAFLNWPHVFCPKYSWSNILTIRIFLEVLYIHTYTHISRMFLKLIFSIYQQR